MSGMSASINFLYILATYMFCCMQRVRYLKNIKDKHFFDLKIKRDLKFAFFRFLSFRKPKKPSLKKTKTTFSSPGYIQCNTNIVCLVLVCNNRSTAKTSVQPNVQSLLFI